MKSFKRRAAVGIVTITALTNIYGSVQAQEIPIIESQELDVEQIVEKLPNLENKSSIEAIMEKEKQAEEKAERERIEAEEKAERERIEAEKQKKAEEEKAKLSDEEIAKLVINGDYGNGDERKQRLEQEGRSFEAIQTKVAELTPKPEVNQEPEVAQISTSSTSQTPVNQGSQSQSQNSQKTTPASKAETSTPAPKAKPATPATPAPKSEPAKKAAPAQGRTMTMEATGYSTAQPSLSRYTANGTDLLANPRVIAVDPSVIPLGSKVTVEGYGTYIAADTGGAIKGNKIDIHFTTVQQALNFGRRSIKITVH